MQTYSISFKYSKNGTSWTSTSKSIKAESDISAIAQIQSRYNYVKDIKITSVK